MPFNPNANWTAAVAANNSPVYVLLVEDAPTNQRYWSTAPVTSAPETFLPGLQIPRGGGVTLDILEGRRTVQELNIEIIDADSTTTDTPATRLLCSESPLALVPTLVNRKVTLYVGFRSIAWADYVAMFTGRLVSAKLNNSLTGVALEAADATFMFQNNIMIGAKPERPASLSGNVVNAYWSILTNTFSLSGSFPLLSFSADTALTTEPVGLGIPTALIDEAQLIEQRDTWRPSDNIDVTFPQPEEAKAYLEKELFRPFHCFPAVGGDGKIGLMFFNPAYPTLTPAALDETKIIRIRSWSRLFDQHLNKFLVKGDWSADTGQAGTTLYDTTTAEDASDRGLTFETVEWAVDSRWVKSALNGVALAAEMAGRMRARFLKPPAEVVVEATFAAIGIEEGDIVAVTHRAIPDLLTGTRGVTAKHMTVLNVSPNYTDGTLTIRLLDTSFKRYGLIAPNSVPVYMSASSVEKQNYGFVCSGDPGTMSNGDPSYKVA